MRPFRLCVLSMLFLSACAGTPVEREPDAGASLRLSPVAFSTLPGWQGDDLSGFANAYRASCNRILKKGAGEPVSSDPAFGNFAAWQRACRDVGAAADGPSLRAAIERNFTPMRASAGEDADGLFTGYYESTLRGSRTKHGRYQHPLLARPADLVMVELGDFRDELKGQRIAGRVRDGKLKPFESRADIVAGKLAGAAPLVWLDDARDAFFVQVQGSGIVHLDDGSTMRVGYDGQNGHAYYAIGRELVKRGELAKEDVSMDAIRQWLAEHPAEADALMNTNKSYVFFREMPDDGSGAGPVGGEGVKLTAGRSLAIDRAMIPYGVPVWLDATYNDAAGTKIRRLMMAQDTGGAIKGAVRGDYFWGSGAEAERMAGPMKARGGYYLLIPKP